MFIILLLLLLYLFFQYSVSLSLALYAFKFCVLYLLYFAGQYRYIYRLFAVQTARDNKGERESARPKLSTRAGPSRRLFSFSFSFSVFVISAHADADAKRPSLFWIARQLLRLPLPQSLSMLPLLLLDAVAATSTSQLRQLVRIAVGRRRRRRLVRVLRCARTRVDYGRRAQICLSGKTEHSKFHSEVN